jgi:hypothetical protein
MSPRIGFAENLGAHPSDFPDLPFVWLEAPLRARLAFRSDVKDWDRPEVWPAGRVFGPLGEYRWQLNEQTGALHGVLILEDGMDFPDCFQGVLELGTQRDHDLSESEDSDDLVLWGEWVNPEDPTRNPDSGPVFYAGELPLDQRYPIKPFLSPSAGGGIPRMTVRRYRAKDAALGEFIRCVEIRMTSLEEE